MEDRKLQGLKLFIRTLHVNCVLPANSHFLKIHHTAKDIYQFGNEYTKVQSLTLRPLTGTGHACQEPATRQEVSGRPASEASSEFTAPCHLTLPLFMEKLSSMKPVPGVKMLGTAATKILRPRTYKTLSQFQQKLILLQNIQPYLFCQY